MSDPKPFLSRIFVWIRHVFHKSAVPAAKTGENTSAYVEIPETVKEITMEQVNTAPETSAPLPRHVPVYVNRELSWLRFNERVLEEAENEKVPLAERLTFASIYQTNLDEFFMVRVGSLIDQMLVSPMLTDGKTKMTAKQQIDAITGRVREIIPRRDAVYEKLMQEVSGYGIHLVDFHTMEMDEQESSRLEQFFENNIQPFVAPTVVGKNTPFPFLTNKTIYAVAVLETKSGKQRLGIIPCESTVIPRLVPVHEGSYILSEELILHFLPKVFKGYTVISKTLIRITRNADIDADALYDEDLDYREFMAEIINRRKRLAPVRLEMSREIEDKIIDVLCTYLKIDRSLVFRYEEPLDLSFLFQIEDMLRQNSELFYPKRVPQKPRDLDMKKPVISQIFKKDRFLSYPYNSMNPFLLLLHEAANDDNVISIKMTLYRVAKQSKVIEYLIEAAENGKEVLVLVELKARFDEENNIEWSRRLESAGCRVIYGLPGYKVHSKLCLITTMTENGIRYVTQIGTGNYNEKTARMYTDLCLMTANQDIGHEAVQVFSALTRGAVVEHTDHLLVAPKCLQNRLVEMMEEQIQRAKAGKDAYIGIKCNSVTDKVLMDKLIEASQAGVKIEMVVRGICCLVPGVPGVTDNIRIISIVGRFLEHSRIYIFGRPGENPDDEKIYIASADFMTRNTLRRVEIGTPIYDPDIKKRIRDFFQTEMHDNVQAREMLNDGTYLRIHNQEPALNSQEYFYEQAYLEAAESQQAEESAEMAGSAASAEASSSENAEEENPQEAPVGELTSDFASKEQQDMRQQLSNEEQG